VSNACLPVGRPEVQVSELKWGLKLNVFSKYAGVIDIIGEPFWVRERR
jgi:hypothetical protein